MGILNNEIHLKCFNRSITNGNPYWPHQREFSSLEKNNKAREIFNKDLFLFGAKNWNIFLKLEFFFYILVSIIIPLDYFKYILSTV